MIGIGYVQRMARYNAWQNASLYAVADALSDDERKRGRGAFFDSITQPSITCCGQTRSG